MRLLPDLPRVEPDAIWGLRHSRDVHLRPFSLLNHASTLPLAAWIKVCLVCVRVRVC